MSLGILCVAGGMGALTLLFFVEVPAGNKEPLLLAIGLVLGWGGSVVASEFGATTMGRNLAAVNADLVKQAATTPPRPLPVSVENGPDKPVPVEGQSTV